MTRRSNGTTVEFRSISKSFGPIQALRDVSLSVEENEVLALAGDNGAGKSTLIKILSGVLAPTSGEIFVEGRPAEFNSYVDARHAGIETVFQELAIAPHRTVRDNIFMGKELLRAGTIGRALGVVDDAEMRHEAKQVLSTIGMDLDPEAIVSDLSGGEQQAVAIARAIHSDPSIMVLDEPTSALSVEAVEQILDLIDRLQEQGLTIILIDHNLSEILQAADRVAVLASGELMGVKSTDGTTKEEIVGMMMGTRS